MKRWATYDIESTDWVNYEIGCVYDGVRSMFADSPSQLVDAMLCMSDECNVFWAHYGGKFDIRFILPLLLERFDCKFRTVGGGLVKVSVYYKNSNNKLFEIRDSYNILPASLRKLAVEFGVSEKMDVDRKNIQKLSRFELEEYVKSDCVILLDVLHKARQEFGIEDFRLTIASQAFKDWKDLNDEKLYRVSARDYDFIKSSYYGGRTEVFKRKGKNLKYFDIVSMYPHVMKKYLYPSGKTMRTYSFVPNRLGIYKCNVSAPKNLDIPFLPFRREDGKLIFPLGNFSGTYTSVEIIKARELGYDIEVIDGLVWESCESPFSEYVDKWFKIKDEAKRNGNGALKYIAKLHLNTLYGKFGQRREFRKVVHGLTKDMLSRECKPLFEDIELYSVTEKDTKPFTYCQIASFVTSYARIELYKGVEAVHARGGSVYYMDTDSLVTDVNIPQGTSLGEWELEDEIDEGIFLLPKIYAYKHSERLVMKAKGFRVDDFKYSTYEQALVNDFSTFTCEHEGISGLFDSARRGLDVLFKSVIKRSLKGKFDKRVLDGYNTHPIVL